MFDMSIMTPEMWAGVLAFIAGLVLVFGAAFRKQAGWKFNPVWSGVIGVILIVFGGAVGVLPMISEEVEAPVTNVIMPSASVDQPTFAVEIENGTALRDDFVKPTVEISEDETSATIVLTSCGESGGLHGNHSAVNFTITPIAPQGATADSLATIYFETDYLMKFSGEYILNESSGVYSASWTYQADDNDHSTSDYSGTLTMLMTETGWAEIHYGMDGTGTDDFGEELDTIGQSGSWDVTFHNADWSWSEVFVINWIYIA